MDLPKPSDSPATIVTASIKQYVRDHLMLRTEAASNDRVKRFTGVKKAVENLTRPPKKSSIGNQR